MEWKWLRGRVFPSSFIDERRNLQSKNLLALLEALYVVMHHNSFT